jgi:uncharacterized protein (TIGR00106 family)
MRWRFDGAEPAIYSVHAAILRRFESEAFMLLAEFSIWPMDKGESVGQYVARCLDIVDRSGLPYKLGPLGTCVEGEWPQVMAVVQKCYEELAKDCSRISCTVKMDWRKGRSGRLESKVDSVEKRLGRKLKK